MRIVLDVNAATGDVTVVSTTEAPVTAKAETEITYPYHDPFLSHTFATKAEHDDWKRRAAERDANLVEWGRAFEAKGEVLEAGQIDCRGFNTDDLYFFWVFGAELTQYVGPRAAENRMITYADVGAFPQSEFPYIGRVEQALLRGGFNWAAYQGPLRALLAQHRGVSDI